MRSPSYQTFLHAITLTLVSAPAVQAQLFIIRGELTDIAGSFVGQFQQGDSVQLDLNIKAPLEEIFLPRAHPDSAEFLVPVTFTIRGDSMLPDSTRASVILLSPAPHGMGLPKADGMAVHLWQDSGATHVGSVSLLTPLDVIATPIFLPTGIPIDSFTWGRDGLYYSIPGDGSYGALEWRVTSYENQSPSFPAVPEPTTFASFAVLSLIGVIAFRRRR